MALTLAAATRPADGMNKAATPDEDDEGEHDNQEAAKKCIMHYTSKDKILLVGEGDFSFSACLAKVFGSGKNMISTSLDSIDAVLEYNKARENLRELEELGCTALHQVDAHLMANHPTLTAHKFDKIIFNFPHAGFYWREHESHQIELHERVVGGFFKSASQMLNEGGEVHVTHKTSHPFCLWNIPSLAAEKGLQLLRRVKFQVSDYPGYNNKRGDGDRFDQSFPVGECDTFMFIKTVDDVPDVVAALEGLSCCACANP